MNEHTPIEPAALTAALQWRYATRKFDPTRRIAPAVWAALEQALVLAPSSFGLQPWKFIVVDDPAVRQKLVPAAYGQTQVVDASHLVVFAAHKAVNEAHVDRHVARTAEVRGMDVTALAGYRKVLLQSVSRASEKAYLDVWNSRQVYIALGQFIAAAALLGVDTSPIEGIQPAKFDEILGLAEHDATTLCICAAGYRAADDKYAAIPKVRFRDAEVLKHL